MLATANSCSDIESGRSALLNLVKALGEYLTSEEDVLRQKGMPARYRAPNKPLTGLSIHAARCRPVIPGFRKVFTCKDK